MKHNNSNGNYQKFSNDIKFTKTLDNSLNRKFFKTHQSLKEKTLNGDRPQDCDTAGTFEPYKPKNVTCALQNENQKGWEWLTSQ